jgi:pimeloyl-ACP methyl ester carboxylesterase
VLRAGGCFCLASIFQNYFPDEPTLSPVEQPTLIIWGQRDRSHGRTEHTQARSLVGGTVREHFLPDHGHYPELEAPELFAGQVQEFVASTR